MEGDLNILFIFNGRSIGGAERLMMEVARKITSHSGPMIKCGLCLIQRAGGGETPPLQQERAGANLLARSNPFAYTVALSGLSRGEKAAEIARIVREEEVDVIHLTNIEEGLRREIKTRTHVPVVETWHSIRDWDVWHSVERGLLRRRAKQVTSYLERMDALVAVHKALEEHIKTERPTGGRPTIIKTIPAGVDIEKFAPARKRRKIVGTCSRIAPLKNLEMFIRVAAVVKTRYENVLFIIIGDAPDVQDDYLRSLEELMAEKDIEIVLTGYQQNVRPWLNLLDVFLFTSGSEGMPLSVLEAMSSGLPVVATKVGGLLEVIEDGKTGFLVDVDDDEAAAEKVLFLLEDENKAQEVGRKARQRIQAGFNLEEVARRYEALFEEVSKPPADHLRSTNIPAISPRIGLPTADRGRLSVSIIMCVSDLPRATRRAIESIKRHTKNYEMIFITDERCSFIDLLKREGKVIVDDRKFNFARRTNLAIASAGAENDIVLLNNDTEVTRGWLEAMRRVRWHYQGNVLIGARTDPEEAGNPDSWGPGEAVETKNTINMFCCYIPRRILKVVGYLDERFIYYGGDDSDYSLRCLRNGFPLVISSAFVHHRTGSSFGKDRFQLQRKTEKIFMEKWGLGHTEINRYARRPLVSVIITNYNYGEYIARATSSILNQTYSNLELIIADDGSTDNSHRIIEKYNAADKRVRPLYLNHQGYARARDAGLALAKGEFFTEQDADDFSDTRRIERSLEEFWRSPALDMVYTNSLVSEDDFKTSTPLGTGPWDRRRYLTDGRFWVATSSILARRFVHKKVGGYDEDYLGVMDSEWLLRADKCGLKFGYVPEALYYYRRHRRAMSGTARSYLMWDKLRLESAGGKGE